MAVNLDTRIPLSAIYDGPTGTERRQASQANELALRLNELRLDYENRKRKREAATDQYMGESIKRIQQGTPEQAVTDFNWNLPQQPEPMRGPMLNAPAYQQPAPLFDVQRRVTAPAVAGRQPNMDDMYAASIDALFRAGDYQGAFDAMKAMRSGQVSQMKAYGGVTKTGADGLEYAFNQATGQYEPTGFKAQADTQKPERPQMVKTARGIEFVTPKPGMVLQPPPEPVKAEKPAMTPYQKTQTEGGLRDDFTRDSTAFREISRQTGLIKAALKDPSAAGTLAAATAFMKMLDPGSVVRESELGMALAAQGVTDRVMNYANVIQSGKVLTASQRQEFGRLADEFFNQANSENSKRRDFYKTISSEYGLNPSRVIGKEPESKKPRSTTAAVGFLKTQKIDSQAKFDAAVRKLKASGWSDEEIREAANKAGL